jgi:hypothetical protein
VSQETVMSNDIVRVIWPLAIAVLGALAYALSKNPEVKELGRGAYWAGMFALAFTLASQHLKL